MGWRKTISGNRTLEGLTMISFVFLLFSFYKQSFWLTFIGVFVIVLCRWSYYYLHHVADDLVFENEKETIRLSVGEQTEFHLKFSQLSRFPIYRATLRVKLESIVEGVDFPSKQEESNITFDIPIHLKGKYSISIPLPLKAKVRGVTRIKTIEMIITNFFGFGTVELFYLPFIHKELIIHPSQVPVPQANHLVATTFQGDYATPNSMFEQLLAPIGTRDYVYTDSFQRIHWKASAKTQSLQTKVYERTSHYSWTIIINLREPYTPNHHLGVVRNLEAIVSNVAYLSQLATKKGIEYELFLNLRMASDASVFHLPKGGGSQQLGRVFDMLSRIRQSGNTLPFTKLLHNVEKQQQHSPIVIFCGPYEEEGLKYFTQLQRRGQKVYFLQDDPEYPSIVPLVRS
jgi:uncharacterized protein (DUF58 family)